MPLRFRIPLVERKAREEASPVKKLEEEIREAKLKSLLCDLKAQRLGLEKGTLEHQIYKASCEEEPL